LNKSAEGFGLSNEAFEMFLHLAKIPYHYHEENFRPMYLKISATQYKTELVKAKNGNDLREINNKYVLTAHSIDRSHPALWEVAQRIGIEAMQDNYSKLVFVDVADDANWSIKEINDIEYLSVSLKPKPKFEGKTEHWYPASFRPEWMNEDELVLVSGFEVASSVPFNTYCAWSSILSDKFDGCRSVLWYPLQKLNPNYDKKGDAN
jgi:hypothetical protein